MSANEFGTEVGSICWRNGCQGVIALLPAGDEGCSCHIAPPCGYCTTLREHCEACDWEARKDDGTFNDFTVKYGDKKAGVIADWKPRPLDPRKIDYRTSPHTHFSQICNGVFPDGTTREQVEEKVRGTFGGRFSFFGDGRFEYVAYTD